MAKIPDVPDSGQRLRGMPGSPVAPKLNADAFGAREAADMGRLGQAVQGVGRFVGELGMQIHNERAQNEAREALVAYETDVTKYRDKAFADMTGNQAYRTPEELSKYARNRVNELSKGLSSPLARKLFDQQRQGYDSNNSVLAQRHVLRENEKYRVSALEARNAQLVNEAVSNPEERSYISGAFDEIKANNAQIYRNAPPDVVDLKNREAVLALTEATAQSLAAQHGPMKALTFLEDDFVKGQFKDEADYNQALRKAHTTYQKAVIEDEKQRQISAGASRMIGIVQQGGDPSAIFAALVQEVGLEAASKAASGYKTYADLAKSFSTGQAEQEKAAQKERAEQDKQAQQEEKERLDSEARAAGRDAGKGEMTLQEMREKAFQGWDDARAKMFIAEAEAERKAMQADKIVSDTEREKQYDAEFQAAGFNPLKTEFFATLTTDEQQKWLERAEKRRKALPEEAKNDPGLYLSLRFDTDADDLLERWSNPETRAADIEQMGGIDSKWAGKLIDYVSTQSSSAKKQQGQSQAGAPKFDTLDSELNNVKRSIELAFASTGRDFGNKDAKDAAVKTALEHVDKQYTAYMAENDFSDIDQIPLDKRKQIQAEAMLSFEVSTAGWLWNSKETVTAAEAQQRGLDTAGARLVPESLPVDLRRNYVDGEVDRIPQANGDSVFVNRNIPLPKLPENVQIAARSAGSNAVVSRELISGEFLVIGPDAAFTLDANGGNPQVFAANNTESVRQQMDKPAPGTPTYESGGDWNYSFGKFTPLRF